MELEIEDALEEIYQNIKINVNYKEVRQYEIVIGIEKGGVLYEISFVYTYNARLTFDANIDTIKNIIDNRVILAFYKKGE